MVFCVFKTATVFLFSFLCSTLYCTYLEDPQDFKDLDKKIVSFLKSSKQHELHEIIPDVVHLDNSTVNVINIINGTGKGLTQGFFKKVYNMVKNWTPSFINTTILDEEFTPEFKTKEHQLEKLNWLRLYFSIHWQLLKLIAEENKPLESLMPEE